MLNSRHSDVRWMSAAEILSAIDVHPNTQAYGTCAGKRSRHCQADNDLVGWVEGVVGRTMACQGQVEGVVGRTTASVGRVEGIGGRTMPSAGREEGIDAPPRALEGPPSMRSDFSPCCVKPSPSWPPWPSSFAAKTSQADTTTLKARGVESFGGGDAGLRVGIDGGAVAIVGDF